ncbi:DUF3017 domain-containing protein [Streptomyces sp. NPDC006906]|uniref:DUF3017 domain-containing protein n=1 Tax=Streptomyces sp. NPDC006906 TaxID=3154782 RepID=UPI0034050DBC
MVTAFSAAPASDGPGTTDGPGTADEPGTTDGPGSAGGPATADGPTTADAPASTGGPATAGGPGATGGPATTDGPATTGGPGATDVPASTTRPRRSRRFPRFTRDTARPEGGGRAAPGDSPAPARQWPLLTVLCAAGLGLLVVVLHPFDQAFRVGTILIGGALITGAVLRWVVPSVGMLAVRSRFTDLVTYGVMGTLIVLLALVAQPRPWLDIPILEDAVRFTIR